MEDLHPNVEKMMKVLLRDIWNFVRFLDDGQRQAVKVHMIAWLTENL